MHPDLHSLRNRRQFVRKVLPLLLGGFPLFISYCMRYPEWTICISVPAVLLLLHYLLWGRALSREVAEERENQLRFERLQSLHGRRDSSLSPDARFRPSEEIGVETGIRCEEPSRVPSSESFIQQSPTLGGGR